MKKIFRKILCLIGFHEWEKQKDPFGFGDIVDGCKHCDTLNINVEYMKIK